MSFKQLLLYVLGGFLSMNTYAQSPSESNNFPPNATLEQCVDFALKNRANINIAQLDEEIAEKDIAAGLSGWLPSVNMSTNYNHNIKIPTSIIGGQVIALGSKNVSGLTFQADQQILNAQLIQATKAAKFSRELYKKNTENTEINTVVEVSKAFYDILISNEQLGIIEANILRIDKQLSDASSRFEVGLVDQTDVKRAKISKANSLADKKRTLEMLKYKYAYLKELIGLNQEDNLTLSFEEEDLETKILVDTAEGLNVTQRVEYQILETQKKLQLLQTKFNKVSYIPTMSAFINYGWDWRSEAIKDLYDITVPRSVFGLNFSFNIFDGNKKLQNLRKSRLLETRLDWEMVALKNTINTQYQFAISAYQANVNDWMTAKENLQMSQDVYDVIQLQYNAGVKNYLELMTSDTDLKTAQINYLNSLYSVLSSKLDVEQALGNINTNQQ
ncbi:MAG TPA: TolC family protein [Chitinophagales bacterium]|nr:TolC family protein [Chitinophagales bacterium]